MNSVKKIILPGVFTAILIGGQFVLSGISGIEIVTVLLLSFTYTFGIKQGLFVANAFSILRCFIFGFLPNVIILYLVYYNAFVIVFGSLGNVFKHRYTVKMHVIVTILAVIMTALFTMFDNLFTPMLYGFNAKTIKIYFIASLYTVIPQMICAFVTVLLIFPPLIKLLNILKK